MSEHKTPSTLVVAAVSAVTVCALAMRPAPIPAEPAGETSNWSVGSSMFEFIGSSGETDFRVTSDTTNTNRARVQVDGTIYSWLDPGESWPFCGTEYENQVVTARAESGTVTGTFSKPCGEDT